MIRRVATLLALCAVPAVAQTVCVPDVPREFRGVWIATVGNIDWPTKAAPPAQQKAELTAMLDRAVALHLNAVIFQVRPGGDAMYPSNLEPWSEYLTGRMGQAPQPLYDPLQFAIEEAHKRGLELHAWFNPFRARFKGSRSPLDSRHIAARRPGLVRQYGAGGQVWMDPGEPEARQHSLSVILDVVRRYDIDGVHLDDYFYPYKVRGASGASADFPDTASYARYRASGGTLARADWRRNNINTFIERLYAETKKLKPWVKVGISPFGIWRSGTPRGIVGLDPYDELYADSRKWLQKGWVDYFSPQLYWPTSAKRQSYSVLLAWWASQNSLGRNLCPGSILSYPASEIAQQVRIARSQPGVSGNVFFSMRDLMRGPRSEALGALYTQPALPPAFPWLGVSLPGKPDVSLADGRTLTWRPASGAAPFLWVLRFRTGGTWRTDIVPAGTTSRSLPAPPAQGDILTVAAVDRIGNVSDAATLTIPAGPLGEGR